MMVRVVVNQKFIVNGREYGSVEELPADVRQAYERAMAAVPHGNAAGAAEAAPREVRTVVNSKIVFNGQEYSSVDAMPPEVRSVYEGLMSTFDKNGNGIPDALEAAGGGALRAVVQPGDTSRSSAASSAAGGTIRLEATGWRVMLVGATLAIAYLAWSLLGR